MLEKRGRRNREKDKRQKKKEGDPIKRVYASV